MVARDNRSPWQPTFAPGAVCARCGTVTAYDETRVVGTLHLHSWQTCDCAVRGKHILTIQKSGPAFPAALLPAVSLSTLTERRAYARAWNRRANRAEAVNAAGAEHVVSGGAVMALPGRVQCPYCKGDKWRCVRCNGNGWMPYSAWLLDDLYRQAIQVMVADGVMDDEDEVRSWIKQRCTYRPETEFYIWFSLCYDLHEYYKANPDKRPSRRAVMTQPALFAFAAP